MGITLIGAAAVIPVMYALHSGSLAAMLVLVPLMIGLCGCMGGLMTSIGPQIYPAGVRATGYNLGALGMCELRTLQAACVQGAHVCSGKGVPGYSMKDGMLYAGNKLHTLAS